MKTIGWQFLIVNCPWCNARQTVELSFADCFYCGRTISTDYDGTVTKHPLQDRIDKMKKRLNNFQKDVLY